MKEKQLVENHVLHCQSSLVEELMMSCLMGSDTYDIVFDKGVLEWWLVTPIMARWLKNEDEVVVEDFGCHWWGRQTSGQAIYLDEVISEICKK